MSDTSVGLPGAISVSTPYHFDWNGKPKQASIPTYTELFRQTSRIPEVLQLMYERIGGKDQFNILSAGCSTGAEADTVLALHNSFRKKGKIALLGVDINRDAIEQAKKAKHFMPDRLAAGYLETEIEEIRTTLKNFGLELEREPSSTNELEDNTNDRLVIDSQTVRGAHDVSFITADLAETEARLEVIDGFKADLVLANNVLYHLEPEKASRFIENLARILGQNGILSVGDHGFSRYFNLMGSTRPKVDIAYGEWLFGIETILERDHGLTSILRSNSKADMPVAFAKQ